MFGFQISTGKITQNGAEFGTGYSGHGEGRNNPSMANVPDIGPIPPGKYKIGPAYDDPHLGPCVMHLDPLPGTDTFGRSLFRIHGNNAANDASHGCVIAEPLIRGAINRSQDRVLVVTS